MTEPSFFEAYDAVLTPALGGHGLVEVLTGAESAGLLDALAEPATVTDLVAATGLPLSRVQALCDVLLAHDVIETDDERHRLTSHWRALVAPDAYATLGDLFASAHIEGRLLRDAAGGSDYWTMPSEDRVTFARAISPNPFAPELVESFRRRLAADPTAAVLADGGSLLELGCGVAGRVLTMLQALPAMRAVGVELSDDLAAEAQRRARELGVDDRFEVVCSDAADFSRPGAFDRGFWSQFFFPESSRAAALRTLRTSLVSGGLAYAPLLGDDEQLRADPHGPEARYRAVFRVILDNWGVPDRDGDGLVAEFTEAGFVDVTFEGGADGGPTRVVARNP